MLSVALCLVVWVLPAAVICFAFKVFHLEYPSKLGIFSVSSLRRNCVRWIVQRYDFISLALKDTPFIPHSHHQLSWYFLKCFFALSSSSVKPPEHFIFKIYFWSMGFFYSLLSFCSTTSAPLENLLPGLFVCLCSPLSFSFISECGFEVFLMQIKQFHTSLCHHYSVTHFLQFSTCLPDLVLAGTSKCKW